MNEAVKVKYLGDQVAQKGSTKATIEERKAKGFGIIADISAITDILNHLTMDYSKTMEEYILLDKVYFLVNLKSCHTRVLNWAYIIPYCPVEDSVVAALRIHQRVIILFT